VRVRARVCVRERAYLSLSSSRLAPQVAKAVQKPPPQRFDHLFALTFMASEEDHWLSDNEGGCTQVRLLCVSLSLSRTNNTRPSSARSCAPGSQTISLSLSCTRARARTRLRAQAMKALGKAWKGCLQFSDAELKIDWEFTRPGVLKLLPKFAKQCKEAGWGVFPWK
jgi:hypothetical protein